MNIMIAAHFYNLKNTSTIYIFKQGIMRIKHTLLPYHLSKKTSKLINLFNNQKKKNPERKEESKICFPIRQDRDLLTDR